MSIGDREYEFIRRLVYEHSRINLGTDKKELVAARVNKRLRLLQLETYADYCNLLQSPQGEEELVDLLDVISTNFTNFFREEKHFEFLKGTALPELSKYSPFCIWSAACSTGEEPYSIAILLAEYFKAIHPNKWVIEATDISTRVLNKAQQGVYEANHVKLPSQDLLRKYFQRGSNKWEGHFRVKDELRNQIRFHHFNLFNAGYPFTTEFQVIFCRNVMIYFDRPTQEQLIAKLADRLVPGGYLFVGHSESLTGVKHTLKSVQPSVYRKNT